jgi:hypothetical protein
MDGYRVRCPFCQTALVSSLPGGEFVDVSVAVKALIGHMKFACLTAPKMKRSAYEAVAENNIESAETT